MKMIRRNSDTERVMKAIEASNNGNHRKAASIYQSMGNEVRNPREKEQLWEAAENARRVADRD